MQNDKQENLVGQEVLYNCRRYRVVADDIASRPLKKEWDLIIVDSEGNSKKIFVADPKFELVEVQVDETSKSHTQSTS